MQITFSTFSGMGTSCQFLGIIDRLLIHLFNNNAFYWRKSTPNLLKHLIYIFFKILNRFTLYRFMMFGLFMIANYHAYVSFSFLSCFWIQFSEEFKLLASHVSSFDNHIYCTFMENCNEYPCLLLWQLKFAKFSLPL